MDISLEYGYQFFIGFNTNSLEIFVRIQWCEHSSIDNTHKSFK